MATPIGDSLRAVNHNHKKPSSAADVEGAGGFQRSKRENDCMVWRTLSGRSELTGTQARQGFLDRPVLVVLVMSTLLVCVLFAVAYIWS